MQGTYIIAHDASHPSIKNHSLISYSILPLSQITPYSRDGNIWGFTVSFLKDGISITDVRVAFDEEITTKHEWVGRGADGFPVLEGNAEEIMGKHFEIRKVDETPVSDSIRSSVRDFCQLLVGAINKYYAFGSCFVDDST